MSNSSNIQRDIRRGCQSAYTATGSAVSGDGRYQIGHSRSWTHAGRSPDGSAVILIPISESVSAPGRRTGGVSLFCLPEVHFVLRDESWQSAAAVLECSNPRMEDTWFALAADLVSQLDERVERPSWSVVSDLLEDWVKLLRARRRLTPSEEVGLWGELASIWASNDPDLMVRGWVGPEGSSRDFRLAGIDLECKTSTRRLSHSVSISQVTRSRPEDDAFLLSMWVIEDPVRGITLDGLAMCVRSRLRDSSEFERRLLMTGYSAEDSDEYRRALTIVELPMLFSCSKVPTVRDVDDGVSELRFRVTLRDTLALDEEACGELLDRLGLDLGSVEAIGVSPGDAS